jgi:hypothetical protein
VLSARTPQKGIEMTKASFWHQQISEKVLVLFSAFGKENSVSLIPNFDRTTKH